MHELVTVDFRNIDRHLGVGRPGGCKRKDGYQGNADALPWHKSPPLKSQFFEKRPISVPIWSTAWKNYMSAGGDGGKKPVWGRIANAKSLGYGIYAIGFAIWLFGYLSVGHAPLFDWNAVTPWWISSFVPNIEAELGMVLMFASMIPIYGGAVRKRAFAYTAILVFVAVTLAWWWFLAWLTLHMIWGQSRR
jgi:hypothetical protein